MNNPSRPSLSISFDRFDLGIIVLLLVSYLIVSQLPFAPKKYGDDVFFVEARTISQILHGAKDWQEISVTRAPGPVVFYAIPFSLVPSDSTDHAYWLAGLIWTMGFISIATLLIRRTSALILDESSGKLGAVLTLLTPFPVYYSYGVSAEPMAYIGIAVACYGFVRWQISKQTSIIGGMALTSFGLILFLLARPNGILLLGIGLVASVVMLTRVEARRFAFRTFGAIAVAGIISFGTVLLATWLSGGAQSNLFSHVLFHGRFQYRTEPLDWRFWDNATRQGSVDYELFSKEESFLKTRSAIENKPLLQLKKEWAIEDFVDHPEVTMQQFGIRMLTMHVWLINSKSAASFRIGSIPGWIPYLLLHVVANGFYLLILLCALLFLVTNRSGLVCNWIVWGPHLSLLIFHGLTYAEPRYLFPSLPGLTIMASVGLILYLRTLVHKFPFIGGLPIFSKLIGTQIQSYGS